jgi:CheY-like chemotaxis protein
VIAKHVHDTPLPGLEAKKPQAGSTPLPCLPRGRGLLIVDSDVGTRTKLYVAFRKRGFAVWLAAHGRQAVQLCQQEGENIDLVLLDVHLPWLDGAQTLEALRAVNPRLRCCFMSAHPGNYTNELAKWGVERFIAKPFAMADLVADVTALLAAADADETSVIAKPVLLHAEAAAPPGSERRSGVRYRCRLEGACHPIGSFPTQERWPGLLQDISLAGARVLLPRRFEVGTLLAVDLPDRDGEYTRRLLARVGRLASSVEGQWELGGNFTTPLTEDELRALFW